MSLAVGEFLTKKPVVRVVTAAAAATDLLTYANIPNDLKMIEICNTHATAIACIKGVDASGVYGESGEVTAANGFFILPSITAGYWRICCNKETARYLRVIRQGAADVPLVMNLYDAIQIS